MSKKKLSKDGLEIFEFKLPPKEEEE